jgi:hypothetical protein
LVLALAVSALSSQVAQAHPYASGISNNTGTISFILNESANDVQVAFDNPNWPAAGIYTFTNDLGPRSNGLQSFPLTDSNGTHTNFAIIVTKAGNGIPFQTSVDTNPEVNFNLPHGIAVNQNPQRGNFGRIYVCNSASGANPSTWGSVVSRTTTQGVFLLNADQSDAVGQGNSGLMAGCPVVSTAGIMPYRINVGPDDMVYFTDLDSSYGTPDYSGSGVGIWMAAPDFQSANYQGTTSQDLFPQGSTTMFGGVYGRPCVVGSLANSNLVVYGYEFDHVSPTDPFVWRYNIGAGPLPFNTPPLPLFLDAWSVGVNGIAGDIALSPDGTVIYVALDRGTPGNTQPPICIYHTNSYTGTTLQQANAFWNCETVLSGHDPFQYIYAFAVSANGTEMLAVNGLGQNGYPMVFTLTNGTPDFSTWHNIDTGLCGLNDTGGSSYSVRGAAFDAAGNYYVSTRAGFFRVYSPGQSTVATTANDSSCTNGTFSITKSALSPRAYVSGPTDPNLDLSGTIAIAEYYGGTAEGVLLMQGVPFVQNNARVGGSSDAVQNAPNFGASSDAVSLADISAGNQYSSAFSFTVPGTAGHSYKLQMLFHDDYSGTASIRGRQFDVKVLYGGATAVLDYNLDLAGLGANMNNPRDVVLTYSYNNTNGSPLTIKTASEVNNSVINGLILKDTTPGYVMPPQIVLSPSAQTKLAGQSVSFQAAALGTAVAYQWQAGVHSSGIYTNLNNGAHYSGATGITLTIANLSGADALDYVLTACNSSGCATSSVAYLTVTIPPGTATVTSPAGLGLSSPGEVVLAEYYGNNIGPLTIGSTTFYNNNARMTGAGFTGALDTPNFGATQDDVNLALISAADAYESTLDFTVPTEAGRNYKLNLVLHDNFFNTAGARVFQVTAGPQGGALAQLGPATIDLVNFGDYETQPSDMMLTFSYSSSGTPIEVKMVGSTQNPVLSAIFLQDVSAGTVPPILSVQPPAAITLYSGQSTNLTAIVGGDSLSYQWLVSTDNGATFNPLSDSPGSVSGSLNSTLTLTVSPSQTGYQYQLAAYNNAGSVETTPTTVTVLTSAPIILTDLPTSQYARVGQNLTLSVPLNGDMPYTCVWSNSTDGGSTWNTVTNGGRISGASSNALTIANIQTNDSGIYQLFILNDQSSGTPTTSHQDAITVLYGAPTFGNNGAGWQMNGALVGGPPTIANYLYTLTDDQDNENDSGFWGAPVYIGAFHANFYYEDINGFEAGDAADGGAFIIQNDPSGNKYLGAGGGGLGYTGLSGPSFALCWDLYVYDPNHVGTPGWCWSTDAADVGDSVNPFRPSGNIYFTEISPLNIDLLYYGGQLTMTMNQAGNTYQTVIPSINLPAMLGANTAYVGFSGATGGLHSYQTVSNFVWEPLVAISSQVTPTNTVVLSWEKNSGLVLESTADVVSGPWTAVPAGPVSGQAIIPLAGAGQFYQLAAPLP